MTIVFAGGEFCSFAKALGAPVEGGSSGTNYDASYSRCAIVFSNGDAIETPALGSLSTAWCHWEMHNPFSNNGQVLAEFYNAAGTVVFQIISSGGAWQMQYWNGAAFVNIGATAAMTLTRTPIDVKIVCGGSGSAAIYIGNTLKVSASASMTAVTDIDKVRFRDTVGGLTWYLSQCVIATTPTVGFKYYTKPPTGNGANTAFTGAFGDVDEAVLNDVDVISSTVANDVETYTGAALTIPGGVVKAVVVSMRGKNDGSAPANVQAALRRGSTNYFSSNLPGLGLGFVPLVGIFETDPSTGVAWVTADAASAATEFGAKSIT